MDSRTLSELNQSLKGMRHQDGRYSPTLKINSKKNMANEYV